MVKLPRPTLDILRMFKDSESITPSQIYEKFPQYDRKDVKYSLRRIREKGIIVRIPNLFDMRRVYYRIATKDEFLDSSSDLKPSEIEFYEKLMNGDFLDQEIELEEG